MSWTSSRIEMPTEWWDVLRDKDQLPSWFQALVRWIESLRWTHMMTQTFKTTLSGWEAAKRYCRFLAEHSWSWMLKAVLWSVEPHPKGHGSHIHALWNSRYDALPTYSQKVLPLYRLVKDQSVRDCLGYSRLYPLDSQKHRAAAYCLKYIVKGLKGLKGRKPMPWEPRELEPLWGMWTPQPS